MAKRISVSLPDELFAKIRDLKEEFEDLRAGEKRRSRKVSSICQRALEQAVEEAEVSRVYRLEGIKDGRAAAQKLAEKDRKFVVKVLDGVGPYKKWSKLERVEEVDSHISNRTITCPRFKKLFDGEIILHPYAKGDGSTAEDRRSEMTWSYLEGCYQGIYEVETGSSKLDD